MSAHKKTTIMISEEEYRKLHDAAMRKRFLEKEIPSIKGKLRKEAQNVLHESIALMENRQDKFFQTIGHLHKEIQETERQTHQDIVQGQEQFFRSVEELADDLWSETTAGILSQRAEFYSQIQQEHQKRQQEISSLHTRLINVEDEEERRYRIAVDWIEAAKEMIDFIDHEYDHQQFTPAELKYHQNLLVQAEQNLMDGIPEAALMVAQQAYLSLSQLRVRLEEMFLEWETLYQAVLEKTRMLNELFESCGKIPAVDLEGNELDFDIDLDLWTEGGWRSQKQYLEDLADQLRSHSGVFETKVLHNLLQETLPAVYEQLMEFIRSARLEVINSQIRINIVDIVLQALEEQGFLVFQQSGYSAGDLRQAYLANVKNLEGSEVIIQVDPVSGAGFRNEVHLYSRDREMRTHHELRKRAKEINHALARHGLQIGTTSTQPDVTDDLMDAVLPIDMSIDKKTWKQRA